MDADEFEFIEGLRRHESAQFQKMKAEERNELQAFQNAVKSPEETSDRLLKINRPRENRKLKEKSLQAPLKNSMRLKIVRKGSSDGSPITKKLKTDGSFVANNESEGLGQLLGDYSSASSE